MREDGGDGEATWAFDVHKERVWVLDQPLKLVASLLLLSAGVQQVDGESLSQGELEVRIGQRRVHLLCLWSY